MSENWIIAMHDSGGFVVRKATEHDFGFGGDALANGTFPTKAAALEKLVADCDGSIALYRDMRRRAKRALRRASLRSPGQEGERG